MVSVAVLGDDSPAWRPEAYAFELWGCRKTFAFVPVKLLDWADKREELEGHDNPFAVFVLAHLAALETRGDDEARAGWKLRLARNFLSREQMNEDRRQWFRLIDWLLELPEEHNRQRWKDIHELEDPTVPFVSFYEREERRIAAEAEQRGEIRGMVRGTRGALVARHGPAAEALATRLEQVADLDLLNRFLAAVEAGASVDTLAAMLP